MIAKVRLDRGVTAQIWGGSDCSVSSTRATSISANGTYTFPTSSFAAGEAVVVCLATSDQLVRAQASLR